MIMAGLVAVFLQESGAQAGHRVAEFSPVIRVSELQKPLFTPARRQIVLDFRVPASAQLAGENSRLDLTLLGTIISGNGRFAVLSPRAGEAVKLRIGEAYGGWELARIDRRSAGFRRGEAMIERSLPEPGVVAPRPVAPTEAAGMGGDPKRRIFNATAIPTEQRSEPFDPVPLD